MLCGWPLFEQHCQASWSANPSLPLAGSSHVACKPYGAALHAPATAMHVFGSTPPGRVSRPSGSAVHSTYLTPPSWQPMLLSVAVCCCLVMIASCSAAELLLNNARFAIEAMPAKVVKQRSGSPKLNAAVCNCRGLLFTTAGACLGGIMRLQSMLTLSMFLITCRSVARVSKLCGTYFCHRQRNRIVASPTLMLYSHDVGALGIRFCIRFASRTLILYPHDVGALGIRLVLYQGWPAPCGYFEPSCRKPPAERRHVQETHMLITIPIN